MPIVKVTSGIATVELDASEISIKELCAQALDTLEKAHRIEREVHRVPPAGFGMIQP
jgi:hypothetical protein